MTLLQKEFCTLLPHVRLIKLLCYFTHSVLCIIIIYIIIMIVIAIGLGLRLGNIIAIHGFVIT